MSKPSIHGFTQLAEVLIQKYERYLPTAFDPSLSIIEKVNKVIEYLNQIGKITNDIILKWNEVMEWVMNEGLSESVNDKINEMLEDGTLAGIINEVIFADLNQRLDGVIASVKRWAIDVTEHGAKGDGTTDDSDAIQTAINHAKETGVNAVFIPSTLANVYMISKSLKIPSDMTVFNDSEIRLFLNVPINVDMISNENSLDGNQNIVFIGGKINPNKSNQANRIIAIRFHKVSNFIFQNVEVMGSHTNGYENLGSFHLEDCSKGKVENTRLYDSGSEGLYLINCNHVEISGGQFYNNSNGSGIATSGGEYNFITNAQCYDNSGTNISLNSKHSKVIGCEANRSPVFAGIVLGHAGAPADYSVVEGCTVIGNNTNGIIVQEGTVHAVITGNIVNDNKQYGIRVTGDAGNVVISDNQLNKNAGGITIYAPVMPSNVMNNTVLDSSQYGIDLHGNNCIVNGNTVKNSGFGGTASNQWYGIYVRGTTPARNIVNGNICTDTQAVKTQARGIHVLTDNNIVTNNHCVGNRDFPITSTLKNRVSGNVISDDEFYLDVTLSTGTITTITNANLRTISGAIFMPITAAAVSRDPFLIRIIDNQMEIGHNASASTTDKIRVYIN